MSMRMLIDARHREETRVAVVKGSRIEEFDFESAEHKQLKGNIYLAKVTRVEPSLQAAFVDYGGNRHGFLAFSEIHPDYYQIPKADRDALLKEEAEHADEEERLRAAEFDEEPDAPTEEEITGDEYDGENGGNGDEPAEAGTDSNASPVDESAADELRRKRQALRRRYKIQDVIQRRQVLLVQVVKEERGNKGAALTTYLSLAGRYCVLMPNTSHGGGISRKISNGADRKRLKSIMTDLKLPKTMGLIVRTAGLSRTKTEIKRDFDYLARLWDEIRERTLTSTAPALIYRDSDLIKRAIRDLYHRDIEEVIVEGEEGYKAARGFMKLLMPSHVRRVHQHSETTPLFQRSGVEDQLAAIQARRVDLDQVLVRSRLRRRRLAQLEVHALPGALQEIRFHCGLIPASFTTLPQVWYSRSMYLPKSAGLLDCGSTPVLCICATASGLASAFTISRLRRSRISLGSLAGPRKPYQFSAS